jgi:hypothetical protein
MESKPEIKKRTPQLFETHEWTAAFKLSKTASQRRQLGRVLKFRFAGSVNRKLSVCFRPRNCHDT